MRRCTHTLTAGSPEAGALFKELATVVRLATKRINLTMAEHFAGKTNQASGGLAWLLFRQCNRTTVGGKWEAS